MFVKMEKISKHVFKNDLYYEVTNNVKVKGEKCIVTHINIIYVCVCAKYVSIYSKTYTYIIYVYIYTNIYTYMYINVCIHIFSETYIHTCVYIYTYILYVYINYVYIYFSETLYFWIFDRGDRQNISKNITDLDSTIKQFVLFVIFKNFIQPQLNETFSRAERNFIKIDIYPGWLSQLSI